MAPLNRRTVLAALGAVALPRWAIAQSVPSMLVHKDPNCGCCAAWVDHIRASGITVTVVETYAISGLKAKLGVPKALMSCHTAEIGGYVIEGHVPVGEVRRLLHERPRAAGLAVAEMPIGSPGMEVAGAAADTYQVIQFGPLGQSTFATYNGGQRL